MRSVRLGLCPLALVPLLFAAGRPAAGEPGRAPKDHPLEKVFDGDSVGLRSTVVVPSLATPLPARGNVVWCGTVEMAWRKMGEVMGGPLQVPEGGAETARLSAAPLSVLPASAFYVDGGRAGEALYRRIETTMQSRFGQPPGLDLRRAGGTYLAYAFLKAKVAFGVPFVPAVDGLVFRDSRGSRPRLRAFGFTPETPKAVREQVRVLYVKEIEDFGRDPRFGDFVLDLDATSEPFQVLVAVVARKSSLEAIWRDVKTRLATSRPETPGRHDSLAVPASHWRIRHEFKDLTGTRMRIENPGFADQHVDRMVQVVTFRLDETGAVAESGAMTTTRGADGPREYRVNRPFLLVVRTRGEDRPFLALWVENAELLAKQPQ